MNTASGKSVDPQPHEPLRSVHTQNFRDILVECGISLIISTYQAGKVVVIRADKQELNTHFRVFDQPMGIAADQEKLAIGTAHEVWELRNVPAVAKKLDPPRKHDACFLPRDRHITGDIDIHEMAYCKDELWFVNTRFSCLCTLDRKNSFVPRWRPQFVSAYDLGDRCHLNGLGVRNNKPRYVTALGETNMTQGWRGNKRDGGILMDIQTNATLVRGLSMPHSPRWYRDRLWVLESGYGSLSKFNFATGKLDTVVQLPGFTRGLSFWGPLAFIGLSQVRESAVFSGLPITETADARCCGIWVVNIDTAQVIAFLRFEDAVQEIFAVSVLSGIRYPELINDDKNLLRSTFVLPDEAIAEVDLSKISTF